MIEYKKFALVPAQSKEVWAQPCPSTDHLPELDLRINRFCQNQVYDLRHINARIEHVNGNRDCKLWIVAYSFEIVDQLFCSRIIVVDDPAEISTVLGVHLVE